MSICLFGKFPIHCRCGYLGRPLPSQPILGCFSRANCFGDTRVVDVPSLSTYPKNRSRTDATNVKCRNHNRRNWKTRYRRTHGDMGSTRGSCRTARYARTGHTWATPASVSRIELQEDAGELGRSEHDFAAERPCLLNRVLLLKTMGSGGL